MTRLLPLAALALLAGLPLPLAALITSGFTPPPPRPTPTQVAAADSARRTARDSAVMAERLDMRAWVDSAARSLERGGAPVTPMEDVPGDSLTPSATPSDAPVEVHPAAPAPRGAARFREGAPAPDTATPYPLLLLVGGALAAAGASLLRRR